MTRMIARQFSQYVSSCASPQTNIGPVLVAINPFKMIPRLYTEAKIREYKGKKYYEMAPHVYALVWSLLHIFRSGVGHGSRLPHLLFVSGG